MSPSFSQALDLAAAACFRAASEHSLDVRIVRDQDGRIQFVVNSSKADVDPLKLKVLQDVATSLAPYATVDPVICRDSLAGDPDDFFTNGWCRTRFVKEDGTNFDVPVRDLTAWGRDWLWLHGESANEIPRVVFHGLKGGVGRSTALALFAYVTARSGKRVLVVDLDLESPGISGLLLSPSEIPSHGVVDWLVEDRLDRGSAVLDEMVVESPLSRNEVGAILVAGSMGGDEKEYLAKLARAYQDIREPSPTSRRFSDRLSDLVEGLERRYRPDVVLIDSRAGLHEIASVAITRLADLALLFALDGPQNWNGYGQLFAHWNSRPDVLSRVRERVLIVRALAGESARGPGFQQFLERSFDLFSNHLYDEIPPGTNEGGLFSFDISDTSAPHYPPIIHFDSRFQEFDPLLPVERGGVSVSQIELAFGPFFSRIYTALGWEEE